MRAYFLVLSAMLMGALPVFPQNTFQGVYGSSQDDYGMGVAVYPDSGVIVSGFTNSSNPTNNDLLVLRVNKQGDTLWKRILYAGMDETPSSPLVASDGSIIISGCSRSFGNGSLDVIFIKLSPNGSVLSQKVYGSIGDEDMISVIETSDGGFLMCGGTNSYGIQGNEIYLIKTNNLGDTLWTEVIGGSQNEYAEVIRQTSDGGYIVGGYTNSSGAGAYDAFLMKLDSLRNITWVKTYGMGYNDNCLQVYQTSNGGYTMSGIYFNASNQSLGFVAHTDASGAIIWSEGYQGVTNQDHFKVHAHGNELFVTGTAVANNASAFLMKLNSIGTILWKKGYGGAGNDYVYDSAISQDGGIYMTGFTNSYGPALMNVYLIKTDSMGNSSCADFPPGVFAASFIPSTSTPTFTKMSGGPAISGTFQVNSFGSWSKLCSTGTTNDEEVLPEVKVYPNPSGDVININYDGVDADKITAIFLTPEGNSCLMVDLNNEHEASIDISRLPAGIYILELTIPGEIARFVKISHL